MAYSLQHVDALGQELVLRIDMAEPVFQCPYGSAKLANFPYELAKQQNSHGQQDGRNRFSGGHISVGCGGSVGDR